MQNKLYNKSKIRVLVWTEGHEPKTCYPQGLAFVLVEALNHHSDIVARPAFLGDAEQGLSESSLHSCEVLIWFGHEKHEQVEDKRVDLILEHVNAGMGFIGLHSSHFAKPFMRMLKSSCKWQGYQETAQDENIKVLEPSHPLAKDLTDFSLAQTEIYLEPFDVPAPDVVVLEGYWPKANITSRELMAWSYGQGKLIYLRAGHETYPIFYHASIKTLLRNAVRWCVV